MLKFNIFFYKNAFVAHINSWKIVFRRYWCLSTFLISISLICKGIDLSCFLQHLISQMKRCWYRLGNIFLEAINCLKTIALSWQVEIRMTCHSIFCHIFYPIKIEAYLIIILSFFYVWSTLFCIATQTNKQEVLSRSNIRNFTTNYKWTPWLLYAYLYKINIYIFQIVPFRYSHSFPCKFVLCHLHFIKSYNYLQNILILTLQDSQYI